MARFENFGTMMFMRLDPKKRRILVFLLLLITVGQFGVDLFLPSLPHIADSLHSPISWVKMTIPIYLIGLGVGQLFYGSISDSIGRKPVVLFGLVLFLISSVGCFLTSEVHILVTFRLLQGLGAGSAIARVILRDVFHGKQMARVAAWIVMTWAVTPVVAPVIGGYIQHYLGWRANFGVMFLYALMIWILVFFFFPETLDDQHKKVLKTKLILRQYKKVFTRPLFLALSLMSSFCYGYFVSFATASPFLFQNQLRLSPVEFGWTVLVIALGTVLGATICSKAVLRFKITQVTWVGSVLMLLSTLSMALLAWVGIFNVMAILVPPALGSVGAGMVFPNCTTAAMTPYKSNAGVAGAAFGFIQMFNSFIFTTIASYLPSQNARMLSIELLAIALLVFFVFVFYVRFHFQEEEEIPYAPEGVPS